MKRLLLRKNKFDRLAINIFFIIIWFLCSFIIWYCIWQGFLSIYPTYKFITKIWTSTIISSSAIVFQLMFIIPSFFVSRYIWFEKSRDKIFFGLFDKFKNK